MKIHTGYRINSTTTFKARTYQDDGIIGFDDSVSQDRREFIRHNYMKEHTPYLDIYEKEPRLEEYPLKKLLNFFAQKPKKVDGESIYSLPLYNVRNISNSDNYTPNIYRGSTLYEAPDWILKKIKDAGIKTVINLAGYGKDYQKSIEEAGLEYLGCNMDSIMYSTSIKPFHKDKIIEFIKTMQKEYIYMGCEFGTLKTDAAIFLNTLFNPNVKGYCKIYTPHVIESIPTVAYKVYQLMTPEDKKAIGWTPEFEKIFTKKITDLMRWI